MEDLWLFGKGGSAGLAENADAEGGVVFWSDLTEDEAGGLLLFSEKVFGDG